MASHYEDALETLYRAPHESFVPERARLVVELKASGDKAAAARLAKAARPTLSAWAVNQLWWHAREAFEHMFQTAAELRVGKLEARAMHRSAQADLSARAQKILSNTGHAANDALLRRVTMTLAGLAGSGSFAPDPPGALSKDREPPGFEAFGGASFSEQPAPSQPEADPPRAAVNPRSTARPSKTERAHEARRRTEEAARAREAAARLQRAATEARAKRAAARRELEARLREAKAELAGHERERERLARELLGVEQHIARAHAVVEPIQAAIEQLQAESED